MTSADVIDVFVSYKREDRDRVAPLVDCLRSAGLHVWWDPDIPGGLTWRAQIVTHINMARCVVVVWSEASTSMAGGFVHAPSLMQAAELPFARVSTNRETVASALRILLDEILPEPCWDAELRREALT
jgi:hypothetical protein